MAERLDPQVKAARREQRKAARAAARKEKAAIEKAEAAELDAAPPAAARLAQVVNLHIAGYSLADIGKAIGASADEVDRMLSADAARYVRSQPALRTYVRNWISERYTMLLESDWEWATAAAPKPGDPTALDEHGRPKPFDYDTKLAHQDRVLRVLDSMRKLHGADAPTQTEVKVEAAPEAVEKLVNSLAAASGLGYDDTIFDVEVVEDAVEAAHTATEVSGNAVEQPQEGDDDGFGS